MTALLSVGAIGLFAVLGWDSYNTNKRLDRLTIGSRDRIRELEARLDQLERQSKKYPQGQ